MTDSPRYVKIEMGTKNGWWVTSEHARLVDPQKYADKVFAQTNWCLGLRITDNDTGEVFLSGGAVPDAQLEGLGSMPPIPERNLGTGHPALPKEQKVNPEWADLLGDIEADTAPDPEPDSAPEPQANREDSDTVLGVVEPTPVTWDDVL